MTTQNSSTTVANGNIQKSEDQNGEIKKLPLAKHVGTDYSYKHKIVWKNVVGFLILHLLGFWGFFNIFCGYVRVITSVWALLVAYLISQGTTMGAHRLFAHRSFKAKPALKAFLLILQAMSGQNCVFVWCRDHRLHHRYSDTDADPHNSKRGFFFCHIGWLMSQKHPYVIEFGKKIDMSDMQNDWMVMLQKKYYYYLYVLFSIVIPVSVPYFYFGETLLDSFLTCFFARYIYELNATWLVNSAAHLWGTRPYDKNMQPVESWFVSFFSLGEGWHNYHHTFPWDYKTAELTMHFNLTASFIRFFEKIGLAYDLKSVTPDMVRGRIMKTGDGTHYALGNEKAKKAVTAFGILHPLNPSFNVTYEMGHTILEEKGLPLYHENDVFETSAFKTNTSA